jgi:hypothetical protein
MGCALLNSGGYFYYQCNSPSTQLETMHFANHGVSGNYQFLSYQRGGTSVAPHLSQFPDAPFGPIGHNTPPTRSYDLYFTIEKITPSKRERG